MAKSKGVRFHKRSWSARIYVGNRKTIYLGSFETKREAVEAYRRAAAKRGALPLRINGNRKFICDACSNMSVPKRSHECRGCISLRRRERWITDIRVRQRKALSDHRYWKRNKFKISAARKQWRLRNAEVLKRRGSEYFKRNRDRILKQSLTWKAQNRARHLAASRKWYAENKKRVQLQQFKVRYGAFAEAAIVLADAKRLIAKHKKEGTYV